MLRAIVARARLRDHVCFASLATLAADTGLHRCTVWRHVQALAAAGQIEPGDIRLNVRTCVWKIPRGRSRIPKCERTPTGRRSNPSSPSACGSTLRLTHRLRGRPGAIMSDDLVLFTPPDPPDRPVHAGDVIATVAEHATTTGAILSSRERGILARQAKELLGDGYDPVTVARACLVAWRRGEPHNAWRVCGDLNRAETGQHMTAQEYRRELWKLAHPDTMTMLDRLDRIARERRERIEQRRRET